MTPNQWNRNTRDSVVSLLTQAGFSEDSSVINQLECMNFDAPAELAQPQSDGVLMPVSDAEEVEVVAYRVSHPLAQWKVYEQRQDWAYREYEHIRYEVQDLMTVAQHKRIMADITANRDALLLVMRVEAAIKPAEIGSAKGGDFKSGD